MSFKKGSKSDQRLPEFTTAILKFVQIGAFVVMAINLLMVGQRKCVELMPNTGATEIRWKIRHLLVRAPHGDSDAAAGKHIFKTRDGSEYFRRIDIKCLWFHIFAHQPNRWH